MWTSGRARRGFNLIELGMGLLLLALIFVPVVEVLRNSVKGTAQSVHLLKAFQAARAAIDAAEAHSFTELDDASLRAALDRLELAPGVERPRADPVKLLPSGAGGGTAQIDVKVVTVRVGWQKTEGKEERGEVVLHGLVLRSR